jgi:hypothetical protein
MAGLRFGLPADETAWMRLETALCNARREMDVR